MKKKAIKKRQTIPPSKKQALADYWDRRNQQVLDKVHLNPITYDAHCVTCQRDYLSCECLDADMRLKIVEKKKAVRKKATARKKSPHAPGNTCRNCGIVINDDGRCHCIVMKEKQDGLAYRQYLKSRPARITLIDSKGDRIDATYAETIRIRQNKTGCKGIDIRIKDDGSIQIHGRENSLCIIPGASNEFTVREIRHFCEEPI